MSTTTHKLPIEHGEWRCYTSRKCRRPECRAAWHARCERGRRDVAYGRRERDSLVDAGPAQARLRELYEQGYTRKEVYAGTGHHPNVQARVLNNTQVLRSTERNILNFRASAAKLPKTEGQVVCAVGTFRRLTALHAVGWTATQLANELGCGFANIKYLVKHMRTSGKVTVANQQAIRALYERGWQGPPPPKDPWELTQQTRSRNRAIANGWPVPLAWDDESIDDPDAVPYANVVRKITHRKGLKSTETADEVEFILDGEPLLTALQVAERLGYADQSGLQAALGRAERGDLLAKLARNAELAGASVNRKQKMAS